MRAGVLFAAVVVLASWFAGDVLVSLTSIPPEKVGPLFGNRRAPEVSYDDLVGLELHAKSWGGRVWNNLQFRRNGFYDLNSHYFMNFKIIEESALLDPSSVSLTAGIFSMTLDTFAQTEAEFVKSVNVTAHARAVMRDGGLPLRVGDKGDVFSTLVYRTPGEALFARIVIGLVVRPKFIARAGNFVSFGYEIEVARPPDEAERLARLQEAEPIV